MVGDSLEKYNAGLNVFSLNIADETLCKAGPQKDEEKALLFEGIFALNALPKVPRLSHVCYSSINKLRRSGSGISNVKGIINAKGQSRKRRRTKLNGFMAYRAFHSRDIATSLQGELSLQLAKEWMRDPAAQLVWKRYATEFNVFSSTQGQNIRFVDWLLRSISDDNYSDISEKNFSNESSRVQDIFDPENSEKANINGYESTC
jgi:hypothetical protein